MKCSICVNCDKKIKQGYTCKALKATQNKVLLEQQSVKDCCLSQRKVQECGGGGWGVKGGMGSK